MYSFCFFAHVQSFFILTLFGLFVFCCHSTHGRKYARLLPYHHTLCREPCPVLQVPSKHIVLFCSHRRRLEQGVHREWANLLPQRPRQDHHLGQANRRCCPSASSCCSIGTCKIEGLQTQQRWKSYARPASPPPGSDSPQKQVGTTYALVCQPWTDGDIFSRPAPVLNRFWYNGGRRCLRRSLCLATDEPQPVRMLLPAVQHERVARTEAGSGGTSSSCVRPRHVRHTSRHKNPASASADANAAAGNDAGDAGRRSVNTLSGQHDHDMSALLLSERKRARQRLPPWYVCKRCCIVGCFCGYLRERVISTK